MKTPIQYMHILLLAVLAGAGFQSCTKTEHVDYEIEPLNKILELGVTNSETPIYGAINQAENTITIYIPYYVNLDYIVPEIKIDQGALLFDTLGNEIDLLGLEPLKIGEPVKFVVSSTDGIQRTYTVIQRFLPHQDDLQTWFTGGPGNLTPLNKPVAARFKLYGNFFSTNKTARFTFTDKQTGAVYRDLFKIAAVSAADDFYTMDLDVVPEAIAGEYEVTMEHQGRETQLPPVTLYYQQPRIQMGFGLVFTPGQPFELNAMSGSLGDAYAGVFVGVKRIYLKFDKTRLVAPEGFPEELYDQELEMEIRSQTRTQLVVVFPDIEVPEGAYGGAQGMRFYIDYDEQTGWGDDVLLGTGPSMYEIKN